MEDAPIFPGRHPFWDVCFTSWVGQADEGGAGDARILLRRKGDPLVAVLASAEVNLN